MKKRGFVDTIVKAGVAAAAIGGTLYLLKDKIEENPNYKAAIDKVKDKLKNMTSSEDTEGSFEDLEGFEDVEDFDELLRSKADRGYVTIKLHEDAADEETMETVTDYTEGE